LFFLACALSGLGMIGRRGMPTLIAVAANLLVILVAPRLGRNGAVLLLAWLCAVAGMSFRKRMPFTFVAVALYLGSLALFVMSCSPGGARTAATFMFTLYFALIAFGWEIGRVPDVEAGSPRVLKTLATILAGVAACLYAGFLVVPHPLQPVFRVEVLGQDAALKLSGDSRIDRSLYINGDGVTFFTQSDDRPVGSVVRYKSLATAPVPKILSDDPGYEPMQIMLMTSLVEPVAFVPLP
jgi:hypothetical protein